MSTTMVMTLATPSLPAQSACCPGCGYNITNIDDTHAQLLQAQAKVRELESQVHLLNEKATNAVNRWADYEDELARLRAQMPHNNHDQQQKQHQLQPQTQPSTPPNQRLSFLQSGTSRLSAFLSPRKSTPELRAIDTNPSTQRNSSSPVLHPPPSPSTEDLLEALNREQNLRKEAETQVATTSKEIEELSAALFEQANEMVAEERRARAKLEERVGELERRDMEKRRRLEKLEGAMNRIERVRTLLAEPAYDVRSLDSEEDFSEQEHDTRHLSEKSRNHYHNDIQNHSHAIAIAM